MVNSASYEEWIDTYQAAFMSATGAAGLACPNCGAPDLRLVFTTLLSTTQASSTQASSTQGRRDRGRARLWCLNCCNGIFLAPCPVPDHAEAVPEGEVEIPDFALVAPGTEAG